MLQLNMKTIDYFYILCLISVVVSKFFLGMDIFTMFISILMITFIYVTEYMRHRMEKLEKKFLN